MKRVLSAGVAITAVIGLAGCGAAGGGEDQLTVVMWGGQDQKTHVKEAVQPWGDEAGVTIKQDSPSDYAKFRAQVESGKVSWDVVEVEPNFAHTACENGWAEKIDTSVVDTSALKPEEVSDCAIPVLEYAFTIGYNTEKFPDAHPTTWAEFFDTKKFPGKRGFWKYATGAIFEAALLADGVAAEDLYPLDIRQLRALRLLGRDHGGPAVRRAGRRLLHPAQTAPRRACAPPPARRVPLRLLARLEPRRRRGRGARCHDLRRAAQSGHLRARGLVPPCHRVAARLRGRGRRAPRAHPARAGRRATWGGYR